LKEKIRRALQFLKRDVWRIRARDLPRKKLLLVRPLRILLLAARSFKADRCSLRASALTYYSILSIVPVFAMAFGIAKGFGLEEALKARLNVALSGHEEVATRVQDFARSLLENAQGGVLAGIGIVILIWTVLKVLSNIEKSFNEIWGVQEPRPLTRKFTDYLAVVLIGPILLVVSGSATVFFATRVEAMLGDVLVLGRLVHLGLRLLPYCVGWALFTFVYIFMPNTRVRFVSALFGGIIAGTMYQILQWVYVTFQVGVTKYSAIYGSFAALPLFLVWLHTTWLIVLFGAELSFAQQNEETYEFEPDCLNASHHLRMLVAARITHMVVHRFVDGAAPADAREISRDLGVPIRLTKEMLHQLEEAGILCATKGDDGEDSGYLPACDVQELTIARVLNALESSGSDTVPLIESRTLNKLEESLETFRRTIEESPANVPLRDV
jgi:membrane protein